MDCLLYHNISYSACLCFVLLVAFHHFFSPFYLFSPLLTPFLRVLKSKTLIKPDESTFIPSSVCCCTCRKTNYVYCIHTTRLGIFRCPINHSGLLLPGYCYFAVSHQPSLSRSYITCIHVHMYMYIRTCNNLHLLSVYFVFCILYFVT